GSGTSADFRLRDGDVETGKDRPCNEGFQRILTPSTRV
ncbi:uncharacterized, partial [Tachysurus ichikawai]